MALKVILWHFFTSQPPSVPLCQSDLHHGSLAPHEKKNKQITSE